MTDLVRLSQIVYNQPHHLTPAAGELIAAVLARRAGIQLQTTVDQPEIISDGFVGEPALDKNRRPTGYRITKSGVAIVPITGELVNRGAWLGATSGLVSYEGLRQTIKTAGKDRKVRAVVLDVDSPGGMATGMIETAALVRELAKSKPVLAAANGMMASAAYGICSGATRIYTTLTSHLGFIGTLVMHLDRSGEMDQRGWKITPIHEGAHKVDGNQFKPLPEPVRQDLQRSCQIMQKMFVATVVAGRPMTEAEVRGTEARIFLGREAVRRKLADSIASFDEVAAHAAWLGRMPATRSARARAVPKKVPAVATEEATVRTLSMRGARLADIANHKRGA
ncbi:MAG: S49 family peptidase [Pseudomonadota bacterium]